MDYRPTNKYLPPRPRRDSQSSSTAPTTEPALPRSTGSLADQFFAWADKALAR
jgi:hypothetical protein